MTCNTWPRPAH